ncbi:CASTOR/POLLUX-related putative ion channel [Scytonema sp. PCC 10023]|uniref:CASTOR/POLLUX-related putative ion channel n=1 Tax=Scytonema sp. PCC 10023 TaxID=1680591 RepID=UPI0039C68230
MMIKRNFQNRVSWQKRLQYNFDNFMSKGGFSVFLALLSLFFGAFVIMTIARYISELLFPNENLENSPDLYWDVFVQLIGLRDTGDNANFATKFVGVITIFVGLVLFSSLVAFITQQFESRLQLLRKGKSPVVEENHTLILGFTDRIIDILRELVFANESVADAVVVILSQQDKEEMDDFLRNNLGELKTTRVVTRNGLTTNLNDLNKVGVKVAKSVIILNDAKASDPEESKTLADARVVKAILAVVAANEEDSLPPIVVELHSQQYRRLAENIAPGAVTTLNEADILARILVQTSRSVGLASVYLNLVGFEGNEFYFYRPEKGWQSLSFGELPFHFLNGTPIGVRHVDLRLTIKPSQNYQLAENDEVVILAEDDSTIQFHPQPVVQPKNFGYGDDRKTLERKPEKHLIIGWNNKTPIILKEYAKYIVEGSQVNLVVQDLTLEVQAEFDKIAQDYLHIKMAVLQANLDSVEQLLHLKPYDYDSISILAGRGENAEEIDAKTLTILLELRQIFRDYTAQTGNKVTTELIAEIIDSEDTDLVIKAGVKDFLLTNQLVSKILAQVSQEPDVMSIYRDLFSVEGSELYIKPISLYFPTEQLAKLTFADCVKAAQKRDELCIGIKVNALAQDKEKNFGIDLVPSLDKQLNLTFNDALITLAEDET